MTAFYEESGLNIVHYCITDPFSMGFISKKKLLCNLTQNVSFLFRCLFLEAINYNINIFYIHCLFLEAMNNKLLHKCILCIFLFISRSYEL